MAALEFLKQEIHRSKSKTKKKIAEEIIKAIENVQNVRRSLPRLKELIPPEQQTYLVILEENKNTQKAIVSAQDKSPILSLATKVPLKYGKGSFSFINDKYTPVSKLSSYSSFVELPISERFHPVYAERERLGFRRAKRGVK